MRIGIGKESEYVTGSGDNKKFFKKMTLYSEVNGVKMEHSYIVAQILDDPITQKRLDYEGFVSGLTELISQIKQRKDELAR